MLQRLAELGMALAEAITHQAMAHADGQPVRMPLLSGGDPALSYSLVARSVRQTLALKKKLAEDEHAGDKRREAEHAAAAERERKRKAEVRDIVEQVIEMEATDKFHAEDLLNDLYDRLEDENNRAFDGRPIALIIARICKNLPIFFDRDVWAEELAAAEGASGARSREPGASAVAGAGAKPPDAANAEPAENDRPEPVPPQRE
jgi:hypothetical protein